MNDLNEICGKSSKLANKLVDLLIDVVSNGKVVEIEDKETGEVRAARVTPDAATLNAARQFCKDFPPVAQPDTNALSNAIQPAFRKALPFEEQKAN